MTSTTLSRLVNGSRESYVPKSLDDMEIFVGTSVKLGTPNKSDKWAFGTVVTVDDCDEKTGDLLCVDSVGNWHAVEPDRVTVGELSNGDICVLEVFRLDRLVKIEEAEQAALLESVRPKKKNEEESAESSDDESDSEE